MTRKLIILLASFAMSSLVFAQATPATDNCEAKAVSKTGKPLHGAAKTAFMKTCSGMHAALPTEEKAAPAKTEQQNKMADCNKEAKTKTGDGRKAFMKDCLSK